MITETGTAIKSLRLGFPRRLLTFLLIFSILIGGCKSGGVGGNGGVTSGIDLGISVVHNGVLAPGKNATYTITVNDVGNAATSAVTTVTDNLPGGLLYDGAGGTDWNCTNAQRVVTCRDQNSIVSGASTNITLTVFVIAAFGTIDNTAIVSSAGDNNTANNSSTDSVVLNGCAGSASGNELVLRGQYAILAQGFTGSGSPAALVASFTADGQGHITGEGDLNSSAAPQHLAIDSSSSSYTVGPDNRACLQLAYSGGTTSAAVFRLALGGVSGGVASSGRVIEFDGALVSGILRLQDPTAFSIAHLQPNYTFGADGVDSAGHHTSIAGTINLTSNVIQYDLDEGGPSGADCMGTGLITSLSATNGRGLLTLTPGCASIDSAHEAIYVVNAQEFFFVQIDPFTGGLQFGGGSSILGGRAVATGNSFSSSSLNGNYILHMTGQTGGAAHVSLALLTFTPGGVNTGTVSGTLFGYSTSGGATVTSVTSASYTVDRASGRVTFTGTGVGGLVGYLSVPTDGISAFLVGEPDDVLGLLEFQTKQTYTSASVAGTYLMGTEDPSDNMAVVETGDLNAGGILTGILDISAPGVIESDQRETVFGMLHINPDGTGDINSASQSVAITNGTKIFFIEEACNGFGCPAVINVLE